MNRIGANHHLDRPRGRRPAGRRLSTTIKADLACLWRADAMQTNAGLADLQGIAINDPRTPKNISRSEHNTN